MYKTYKILKGGFYPSIMAGVLRAGSYLLPLAIRQGSKLLETHNKMKKKGTKKMRKIRK